jgi:hypothetical protein
VEIVLNAVETRVLGALLEKELTTPDYYPLSLHALVAACNQKSNRDPVMTLDENAVKQALRALDTQGLAGAADTTDSRVTKYEHRLGEAFNFGRPESAILCELLLRGPQTPGELRSRAARMHPPSGSDRTLFDDLESVLSTLQRLMRREPPLVKILPRQPGTKESRYAQLLSSDVGANGETGAPGAAGRSGATFDRATDRDAGRDANREAEREADRDTDHDVNRDISRIGHLEQEVAGLRSEIASLKQQLADFRKQFD